MYNISGEIATIAKTGSMIQNLPAKTWLVCFNPEIGYFLKVTEDLKLPSKIYGHNTEYSDKIIKMFQEEQGRTSGAILSGVKGSGKTLTAIETCISLQELGMPVLLLQEPHCGTGFNDFMASIKDSCVVFVDEFEKVYKEEDHIHQLLPLLDGAVKTHKLFLLTSNKSMHEVGESMEYLYNRPSRIFYAFEYGTMDDAVINEYLDDHLKFEGYRQSIFALKRSFKYFTMDILKAVVVEVNRYGESGKDLSDILSHLNVQSDRGLRSYEFATTLTVLGKALDDKYIMDESKHQLNGRSLEVVLGQCEDYMRGGSYPVYWKLPVSRFTKDELDEVVKCSGGVLHYFDTHSDKESVTLSEDGNYYSDLYSRGDRKPVPTSEVYHKVRLYLCEEYINNGCLEVTQDELTRSINLSVKDADVVFCMRPVIKPVKKDVVYMI